MTPMFCIAKLELIIGDFSGDFTTESCRKWLDDNLLQVSDVEVNWLSWVPLTVRCFILRLLQHRLPLAPALRARGVDIPSGRCPLCLLEDENEDHTFVKCPVAKGVWCKISKWMNLNVSNIPSIMDLSNCINGAQGSRMAKRTRTLIGYCTCWMIWLTRNRWLFANTRASVEKMVEEIKILAYSWMDARRTKWHCTWEEWVLNPITGVG
ncbi:hypothetical protein L1987_32714 [Smallanthus sonchifolius]|uniref:Uncharacterized protein n=1 Tax=Smallanthus sonchifolius TaxID=185202 RepID=A0ACB9HRK8_9ASTR|nr:hypothetical protein L1987_32714 [Smallanthus sonchifolius]